MDGRHIRLLHALAQAEADYQLALTHIHLLLHIPGLGLHRVHADIGAQVIVDLPPGQGGQSLPKGGGNLFHPRLAAVEQLHRAGLQKRPVVPGQLLVVDVLGLLLAAQAADGEVLKAAHLLDAAGEGIAAFVVDAAADALQQLLLLAVHILGQQQAAPGLGREQHVRHQAHGAGQQRFSPGQIGLLREAAVKADAMDLAHPAHHRLNGRAVKLVHPAAQGFHIAVAGGAPAEHIGEQGVHGSALPPQLGQQGKTHACGLEFVAAQMAEKYAGQKLCPGILHGGTSVDHHFL